MDFVDIDLDVWCQQIFGSIDGVLSPLYTAAMQIVDTRKQTDYLDQILAAKQALAAIVKDWMIPVFAGETADPAAVREDFYQQLLVRLSNAYTTSAGVQFEAAVVADVHEPSADQPPRLYGDVLLPEFAGATVDTVRSTVLLTFRVTLGPSAGDPANYTISGGISVIQAALSPDRTTVTLTLASDVTPGTTTVTVSNLLDEQGSPLLPPFTQTVLETGGGQTTDSISFTSPKLTLQSGRQPLSFLVTSPGTVKGPGGELLAYVDVDLTYRGSSIEHQIGDVAGIDGYQASSWLSFVLQGGQQPLTADLGGFPIPLPLRAFPTTPTMAAQSGDASYPDVGDDLSKATKWDYSFTYSLPYHYPQDRVDGVVEFNVQQVAGAMAAVEDAFAQLAEFVAVFPSVDADFQSIVGTIDATTTDATTIENAAIAISSFHQLMNDIVVAASAPGLVIGAPPRGLGGAPDLTFSFFIEEGIVEATGALLVSLVVVGSLPDGLQSPTVLVDPRNYDCVPYAGTPDDGTYCDETGRYCFVYKQKDAPGDYLTAAVGQAVAGRTVVLPGLDILQRQDAWSTVSIERNKVLVPGKPSAEPFVYSTPMVRFANPLHPSIDSKAPINMSEITTPPPADPVPISRSLFAHIEALFAALLVSNSQPTLTIQVEVAYAYPLNPLLEPIVLPVLMQAPLDVAIISQGTSGPLPLAEMTQNWATAVTRWFSTRTPPLAGGQLLFDLRIMSNLTEHPMPLVQLEQLFLPVEWIVPPLG
jgi:hypothetical protein